jgi:positive regulator of sigma E activity
MKRKEEKDSHDNCGISLSGGNCVCSKVVFYFFRLIVNFNVFILFFSLSILNLVDAVCIFYSTGLSFAVKKNK